MTVWLRLWNEACKRCAAQRLPDEPLRGTGQVMFQNHRVIGAPFLAVNVTRAGSVSAPTAPYVLTHWLLLRPRPHFIAPADAD